MLSPIPFRKGQVIINVAADRPTPIIAAEDPSRCPDGWCYGFFPATSFRRATATDIAMAIERVLRDSDILESRLTNLSACLRAMEEK